MTLSQNKNDTPSSTRVRDNQRRSRTRRATLLDDLQTRVHEYERQGVTATLDMQRAARRVAHDNVRLRNLLALHGVSREEVESHLQSSSEGVDLLEKSLSSDLRSDMSLRCGQSGVHQVGIPPDLQNPQRMPRSRQVDGQYADFTSQAAPLQQQRTISRHPDSDKLIHDTANQAQPSAQIAAKYTNAPYQSNTDEIIYTHSEIDPSICHDSLNCFCAPMPIHHSTTSASSGLEISCETAAKIIAEMRGDGDRESVRASLGCSGLEDCNIKNTTVLQIMDER